MITRLKPNVTRAQAVALFNSRLREARRGRLCAVVELHVPFRLCEIEVVNGGRTNQLFLAVDAVTGRLDPYELTEPPQEERTAFDSRRIVAARMDEAAAVRIAEEKARRAIYLKGFFRVKNLSVRGRYLADLHVPYWVGVYRRGDAVSLEVIDAVRNRFEGTKLREMAAAWFAESATDASRHASQRTT
jgi:hypothetical protein